jgi:2,4-didehydro-3-deoxy-L-rhamnonate hydrolase
MALNIARVLHQGQPRWAIVNGARLKLLPSQAKTTGEFIRQADPSALRVIEGEWIDAAAAQLLSPVTQNQQFICLGANYRQHMIESGVDPDVKTFNMVFTKASTCIVPADSDIVRPAHVRLLDYEVELGLILRRDVTGPVQVTGSNLGDLIAALVIVDDVSARDIQIPQMQFYKGKSYRTFGPVGPYLCLLEPDDIRRIAELELTLSVNGATRQRDKAANLVYGPAETLTELSGLQDLFAGDLIATGTPAGCALSVPSPRQQKLAALLPERARWRLFFKRQEGRPYLEPGDLVEARIASPDRAIDLGVQRNRVVAA